MKNMWIWYISLTINLIMWAENAENVVVLCECTFKTLVEQLCLDGILTMTFNTEARGLRGSHAGKRSSMKACQLLQNP